MSIHSNLMPLPAAAIAYDWPTLAELGSGGFASVRALGPSEVLKLTCCTASNDWLKTGLSGKAGWPKAFPRVYESLGPLAVDADGMVFHGWRLERLFCLEDKAGAIAARSASVRRRMRDDAGAAARAVAPDRDGLDALFGVIDYCDVEPHEHWRVDADACLLLAGACQGDLREGFVALRSFILKHSVKLDVSARSNIMMDCFGRLRLADPLTMKLDAADDVRPARPWLAMRVPLAQRGFSVATVWCAVPCAAELAAKLATELSARPGILTKVCTEAEAAKLVAQPETTVPAFEFSRELGELLTTDPRAELFAHAQLR